MSTSVKNAVVRNWKTTVLGIAAAITVISQQVVYMLDNDPNTVVSWELLLTGGFMALIGVFAKDGDKSTEEVNNEPTK